MLEKAQSRPDLFLLLSLLFIIVMYPVLNHGDFRRILLGASMFTSILLATVRLAKRKGWVWPTVLLMAATAIVSVTSNFVPAPALISARWALLTAFFALAVAGLFPYLKNARSVTDAHLYTAMSIYLLLGMQWFALYSAIEAIFPGAILHNNAAVTDRHSELLYFSLVTLSTVGYGDVVPLYPEVRMLAALEGITGVLYVAITVAMLVSAYKQQDTSSGSSVGHSNASTERQ